MAYNAELQMLRELAWLLIGKRKLLCGICGERLMSVSELMTFGHRRHKRILHKFTVHHKDENRGNNADSNLALVHTWCHKAHHAKQRSQRENSTS